jgi:ribosomal protein L24
MKIGDKVKVVKGDCKGAIGYIIAISEDFITVEPADEDADNRVFHIDQLKVMGG